MEPICTIITTVYMIEQTLLFDCLNSLKKIQLQNIEFLLIDDGSPDCCGRICDMYSKSDDRFVIYHINNGGVAKARNFGIEHARGRFVFFLDGDDKVYSEFFSILPSIETSLNEVNIFNITRNYTENVGELLTKTIFSDVNLLLASIANRKIGQNQIDASLLGSSCGKLISRKLLNSRGIRFDDRIRISEDRIFMTKVLLSVDSIAYYNINSYIYTYNEKSYTHSYDPEVRQNAEVANNAFLRIMLDCKNRISISEINECYESFRFYSFIDIVSIDVCNKNNSAGLIRRYIDYRLLIYQFMDTINAVNKDKILNKNILKLLKLLRSRLYIISYIILNLRLRWKFPINAKI